MLHGQAATLSDPARRKDFLNRVPVNRAVLAAWEQSHPIRQGTVVLPSGSRTGEWVTVTWTLESPEDAQISDKVERRRKRLERLLSESRAQGASPTAQHLADALGVGLRTLERDLAGLKAD